MMGGGEITTGRRKPSELVAEYEAKAAGAADAVKQFAAAGDALKMACSIGGTFGYESLSIGNVSERDAQSFLRKSAWRHLYGIYDLESIVPAADKRRIEMLFTSPPPFTVENIREHLGAYFMDPWGAILRGLAEAFSALDPAFKSHEKVKIGVKGLPKRVILSNVSGYGSWGRDRLRDILNALAAYQGKPLVEHAEIEAMMKDGEAIKDKWTFTDHNGKEHQFPARGAWLKKYQNGNGHLYFAPDTLADVNRALAEFYGDVLPDAPTENTKRQASTAVSKDLQYYPTPSAVVDRIAHDLGNLSGKLVLEPSCGCGRIMDRMKRAGADCIGVEVDAGRAAQAKAKGHKVIITNFLDTAPDPRFDIVAMNPPFYGRHYAKHVRHALRFLKPGGKLVSILPATARYDHGELDDLRPRWSDLPVGSFSESGTNINTTVCTIIAQANAKSA